MRGHRGRPQIAGSALDFNVSHTRGTALFAVTRHGRVGADIEHRDRTLNVDGIARKFMSSREQALLATDEGSIGSSLNALTASFNEANRWLNNQRDLLGVFETTDYQRLPQRVLSGSVRTPVLKEGESS